MSSQTRHGISRPCHRGSGWRQSGVMDCAVPGSEQTSGAVTLPSSDKTHEPVDKRLVQKPPRGERMSGSSSPSTTTGKESSQQLVRERDRPTSYM